MTARAGLEEAIRTSYLTQGFEESHLALLLPLARVRSFQDGEPILIQNEPSRDLLILMAGAASIVTVVGGSIGTVRPGMPIGELSFLDSKTRSVSVVSCGPSEVASFPYRPLRDLLDQNPRMDHLLLKNISSVLCARLRHANNNIAALLAVEDCPVPNTL